MMKIKIYLITEIYLIVCLIAGFFDQIMTIYVCLLVHEVGHYIMIKIFKKDILLLEISPLGGILHVDKCQNDYNYKELLIYMGGPLASLALYLIFKEYHLSVIWQRSALYVLILNLLPILPLDGAKILMTLKQYLFPLRKVQWIISFISIGVCIFLMFYFIHQYNYVIILGFFLYLNLMKLKDIPYEYYDFLWYKYLHPNPKLREKMLIETKKVYYAFYKGINHIFFINQQFISEKDMLKKLMKQKR